MVGPLDDLLVVDLTRVLAGPFVGMMLADLGARVIKVERPGTGDDSRAYGPFVDGRSLYFARVNRGKESIALDLRDPDDREVLRRLLERADVLVENFRPGVMRRLGLGPDDVATTNPRLVYCSVSGFGHTGPWSARPAYDAVVQGVTGLMSITGRPDGPPVKPGIPVADLSAGLYGFGAVLAALHARQRTGQGAHVDVAMHDSVLSLLESAALNCLADGTPPPRIGNAHYSIAPFDTFACDDGEITVCAANDAIYADLCAALSRPDLAQNPLFASNSSRWEHRAGLTAEIESALAGGSCEEWLVALDLAGIPCGPVADVAQALASEQAAARDMVVRLDGLPMPGNPIRISGYDAVPTRPAPALDQHGAALREELGS